MLCKSVLRIDYVSVTYLHINRWRSAHCHFQLLLIGVFAHLLLTKVVEIALTMHLFICHVILLYKKKRINIKSFCSLSRFVEISILCRCASEVTNVKYELY